MKNWLLAEFGFCERAAPSVPRSCGSLENSAGRSGYCEPPVPAPQWRQAKLLTGPRGLRAANALVLQDSVEAIDQRLYRLLAQAARLYFGKKLPVFTRPEPCSPHTIRQVGPGSLERLGRRVLTRFFAQLDHGCLTLTTADGDQVVCGDPQSGPQVAMTVHRHRFWQRAMLSADIGFGESYTDGDWDSPDLVALLSLLALREEAVNDRRLWPALAGRAVNFLHHLRRDNTPAEIVKMLDQCVMDLQMNYLDEVKKPERGDADDDPPAPDAPAAAGDDESGEDAET